LLDVLLCCLCRTEIENTITIAADQCKAISRASGEQADNNDYLLARQSVAKLWRQEISLGLGAVEPLKI
jgi:hypothetical protein